MLRSTPDAPRPAQAEPWPHLAWHWADAAAAKAGVFTASRASERRYERILRNLATAINGVISKHQPRDAEDILRTYAETIAPWARQTAANMLDGVSRDNADNWQRIARKMGLDMRAVLQSPYIAPAMEKRMEENVRLIRSLPMEAALRCGDMAHEGLISGRRAEDMTKEILSLHDVTLSRARCIALTEVSKAHTALTQARAASVGSEGYIWRSVRDGVTRTSHRAMEGKFVPWNQPPTLDGMTGHAGEFPYCRCYPEPVVPKGDGTVFAPALPTYEQEQAAGKKRLLTQWEKSVGAEVIPHVPGEPLPNAERAHIPAGKLAGCVLNPDHTSGKHKARLFKATLGFTPGHERELHQKIVSGLAEAAAERNGFTAQGAEKFTARIPITGPNGKTVEVKTVWQYLRKDGAVETRPRLITAYPM